MPRRPLSRGEALMRESDLVLVVGSTLVVHPAASLPALAVRTGSKLAIVNQTSTPLDGSAAVLVSGKAGETLPRAVALAAELQ